jgi:hypothetical protein
MHKLFAIIIMLVTPLLTLSAVNEKPRVIILTDIENEPDDAMSLVRFLLYTNQFDTEGIVATTSCWQQNKIADWRIFEILNAYAKIRSNLLKHEPCYPTAEHLHSLVKRGYPDFGMNAVGEGKDSEGSDWIIKVLEKNDDRPVWVLVWGGANTLAQAVWRLHLTRPEREFLNVIKKLRVYTISDQDNTGPWMRRMFPDLFYIVSPGFQENNETGYQYATWTGISGERWYKYKTGADATIVDNTWVKANIQRKGPLGAEYPDIAYIMEGDTPSFLYLINNGLGSSEHPDYGSWGGRYEFYTPPFKKWHHESETRPIWTNTQDMVWIDGVCYISDQATIWRWRNAYQNDFSSRMDWTIKNYNEANHPPVVKLSHNNEITVKSGEKVILDGSPSSDPDGNQLKYNWYLYFEPGSYLLFTDNQSNKNYQLDIADKDKPVASFSAPKVDQPKDMHIILEVTDNGTPALTRYKRVIVNILPN